MQRRLKEGANIIGEGYERGVVAEAKSFVVAFLAKRAVLHSILRIPRALARTLNRKKINNVHHCNLTKPRDSFRRNMIIREKAVRPTNIAGADLLSSRDYAHAKASYD